MELGTEELSELWVDGRGWGVDRVALPRDGVALLAGVARARGGQQQRRGLVGGGQRTELVAQGEAWPRAGSSRAAWDELSGGWSLAAMEAGHHWRRRRRSARGEWWRAADEVGGELVVVAMALVERELR